MRSSWTKQIRLGATLLLITISLGGCAKMTAFAATSNGALCDDRRTSEKDDGIMRPITWSPQDTDQTIREVKGHNAAWKALCK